MKTNNSSFEKDMQRLETITAELGKQEIALDRSLELYQEAVPLIEKCKNYIQNAKLSVEKLGAFNG